MKVIFKLTNEQIKRAESAVVLANTLFETSEDEYEVIRAGNCLTLVNNGWLNPASYLDLRGERLHLEGERNPIREDGALQAVALIAGYMSIEEAGKDSWQKIKVVAMYSRTRKTMPWWHSWWSWVIEQGNVKDLDHYVRKVSKSGQFYIPQSAYQRFKQIKGGNKILSKLLKDGLVGIYED